jgi:RNase P subunit RPR2
MSYPNAFCVKCGQHTESLKKHTVVMQNGSRAVKGVCAACATQVYKIVPKDKDFKQTEAKSDYPDAFCVKCQAHTPTKNARTVLLDNHSRAVTGSCAQCGSEVYRILSQRRDPAASATRRLVPRVKEGATTLKIAPNGTASSQAMIAQAEKSASGAGPGKPRLEQRRAPVAKASSPLKSAALALTVIGAIVGGFFAYVLWV